MATPYLIGVLRLKVEPKQLLFRRSFTGVTESSWPLELSQKLVHSLGVYWVDERSAFCRLDSNGNIEDVIRVIWLKDVASKPDSVVVTILTKELATYMALADMSLVLKFDFTRFEPKGFIGWPREHQSHKNVASDLFYKTCVSADASYANGIMILRPGITADDLIQEWKDEDDPKRKQYASFKILDWKNKRQIEPPRDSWRLQLLREWSHEQVEEVFP